ncbi:hypothetical protein TELCIR_06408 [Teladorsagia circumcincta]|uniref:Tc1-like transposase DDE domain-containing protein n=1 Tax=Teladorsagia circumcincta TaxID=45464 RepID=A0A2G9UNA3_TELCI|nr:hypothetical protein TELCIR_06408 [Teladorsagia circumcincta]
MSSRIVNRNIVRLARNGLHFTEADIRRQASTHEGPNLSVDTVHVACEMLYQIPSKASATVCEDTVKSGTFAVTDNYPKHKSKLFTKWFHDNIVPLLQWLSRSPDFNPIEDLWDELELQVKDPVAHREPEKFPQLTTA